MTAVSVGKSALPYSHLGPHLSFSLASSYYPLLGFYFMKTEDG